MLSEKLVIKQGKVYDCQGKKYRYIRVPKDLNPYKIQVYDVVFVGADKKGVYDFYTEHSFPDRISCREYFKAFLIGRQKLINLL
jgi:hypothetical protein